jgi:hypothetical protein
MLQMQPMPTAKKTHTGTSVNRDSTRFTILLLLPDQQPCKPPIASFRRCSCSVRTQTGTYYKFSCNNSSPKTRSKFKSGLDMSSRGNLEFEINSIRWISDLELAGISTSSKFAIPVRILTDVQVKIPRSDRAQNLSYFLLHWSSSMSDALHDLIGELTSACSLYWLII